MQKIPMISKKLIDNRLEHIANRMEKIENELKTLCCIVMESHAVDVTPSEKDEFQRRIVSCLIGLEPTIECLRGKLVEVGAIELRS